MTRFSPERFSPRARPWLVLWLLPYLVLSVAATVHNHGFGACESSPVAATVSASVSADAGCPLAAASDVSHDVLCLACQWTNIASAFLAASPFLFVAVAATSVFAALLRVPTRRSLARAAIRGPPLS